MSLRPTLETRSAFLAPPGEPGPRRRPLDAEKLERLLNEDDELPSPDELDEAQLAELADDDDDEGDDDAPEPPR